MIGDLHITRDHDKRTLEVGREVYRAAHGVFTWNGGSMNVTDVVIVQVLSPDQPGNPKFDAFCAGTQDAQGEIIFPVVNPPTTPRMRE